MRLHDLLPLTLAGAQPNALEERLDNGITLRWLTDGALLIEPSQPGPLRLLLSAGIHGNETAPIELLDRLLRSIVAGTVTPKNRLLLLFGNPQAMAAGTRYQVQDMNRLFNGRHAQHDSDEARRAGELEQLAHDFFQGPEERLHYDLHTAIRGSHIERFALYPWQPGRHLPLRQAQRLGAAGIEAIVTHNQRGGTFSAFTHQTLAAESLTLELGKARPFGENDDMDHSSLEAVIKDLLEGNESRLDILPERFSVAQSIIKTSEAFTLHLAPDISNFTLLPMGSRLAEDAENTWEVKEPQTHVLFANQQVQVGLRAALLVTPDDSLKPD